MILTKKRLEFGLPLAILLLISATTLQDLLASVLLERGFFISESLLFKIVWVLFFPAIAGLWYFRKTRLVKSGSASKYIGFVLIITAIHLVLAGWLISLIARFGMGLPFSFIGVEKYIIAHQGPVILLLYGLVFGGLIHFREEKAEDDPVSMGRDIYSKVIPVRRGRKLIPVPVKEILYIKSENPYSCLVTPQGRYLTSKSLKQLQRELDPTVMVRIHRSTIVNVKMIQELRSRLNGDYDVYLKNNEQLRWSRNYPGRLQELLHLGH